MVCHRSGASLVTCCADLSGCPVDRPTNHRGAVGAPLAGLDSPRAVSGTIQIRSAEPNLARFPACCHRRGRRALLPAPWIRLARDSNRCSRRYGRWPPSWRVHPYTATGKKSFLRDGPLDPPQGCRVHACPGGRVGARQAPHSGTLPQRGRMGPWYLWCGVGVSLLLPNLGPEYRPATVSPTRCNSTVAPEATARSHDSLQRTHPRANASSGLVIAQHILWKIRTYKRTPHSRFNLLFLISRIRVSVGGGTAERPCVGQKFSAQEFLTNSPTQGCTTVHACEWFVLSSIVSYGIDTTVKTARTASIQRNLTLILQSGTSR